MAAETAEERPRRKSVFGRVVTAVLVLGLAGGGSYAYRVYLDERAGELPPVNQVAPNAAKQQATLVDQEDTRIMQIRAKHESDLAAGGSVAATARQPHYANSANGRTMMLPQRRQPYYVSELERIGRNKGDFVKQADGSYLLSSNIFVARGGKLILQSASGPLTIRMRSVPGSFVSIVSSGGTVKINGSAQNPVRFTSWNDSTRKPDTEVADGRAYIRALGGEFTVRHAALSDLGFWSGRTGGLALTGSDRPDSMAEQIGRASGGKHEITLPGGEKDTTTGGRDEVEVNPTKGGGKGGVFQVPSANLVNGSVEDSTITGNAYGLFVTAADRTQITNNRITGSLVDGVLLHRFAKNAVIENTTVTRSRGDGFVLSRGTEGVRVTNCTAEHNGGNGFTLDGQPLADGESASGEGVAAFGDNVVASSTARDNRRYGVELLGGDNVAVQNSRISGGDMGIVVRDRSTRVQITGNQIRGPREQGVMLRDGVTGATVSGNVITGGRTALYLRAASGQITGNTVQDASRHGVTLRGDVSGAQVTGNTVSGTGTAAFDVDRATGRYVSAGNKTGGWHTTPGLWTWLGRILKPMNLIWAAVFLLVVVSAYRSRGTSVRIGRRGAHPYEQQARLEERPVRLLRRTTAPSSQER